MGEHQRDHNKSLAVEELIQKLLSDFEEQFEGQGSDQQQQQQQQTQLQLRHVVEQHQRQEEQQLDETEEAMQENISPVKSRQELDETEEALQENISPVRSRHMIAERQRRRREAELLATLKSLLPFPTKRDKLSVLQGAIRYLQELQFQTDYVAISQCDGSVVSKQQFSSNCTRDRVCVMVEHTDLICALEQIKVLGYEVDSIHLHPPQTQAEVTVHPIVQLDGGAGLQEMINQMADSNKFNNV